MFLPEEWASDTGRLALTRVPPEVTHREKWRLALGMLVTLASWGMRPPVVVADAAYGTNAHLQTALSELGLAYVLAIRSDVSAHPFEQSAWPRPATRPSDAGPSRGTGRRPRRWLPWPSVSGRRHSPITT
ncbi:transposase [Streptomyces sp. NPDC093982]|uniref:transposase n=1 Tax=Streptomyces sp. NPDC093982 TaxID=3155077 RepID=UPI0034317FB0